MRSTYSVSPEAEFCGSGRGLLLIDEIGKAEKLGFGIVNGDGEVAGAHEFIDDAVDGGEELLEILGGAGFLGDAVESGAESFGALALGDVAIDGVEGDGLAVDDEGSGGNGNVEQAAVFAAALGFESEAFAALEALDDPLRFGGAIGGENEVVDGFAQNLDGGVTEHALKFLVDALGARAVSTMMRGSGEF